MWLLQQFLSNGNFSALNYPYDILLQYIRQSSRIEQFDECSDPCGTLTALEFFL